jgi:hypothetical protein
VRDRIVQIRPSACSQQLARRVEMEEVRAFEIAGAIAQPGRGEIHGISGPQNESQQAGLDRDAFPGEKAGKANKRVLKARARGSRCDFNLAGSTGQKHGSKMMLRHDSA